MTYSIETFTLELERRVHTEPADDVQRETWRLLTIPATTDRAAPSYEAAWAGVTVVYEITAYDSITPSEAMQRLITNAARSGAHKGF